LDRRPPLSEPATHQWRHIGEENHALDETGDFLRNLQKGDSEQRAVDFERYLKSGSGRAFAKRHFG
jgi:hypothetical protein